MRKKEEAPKEVTEVDEPSPEQEAVNPDLERQAQAQLSQLRLQCAQVAQCDGSRGSLLKTNNLLRYVLTGYIQEVGKP